MSRVGGAVTYVLSRLGASKAPVSVTFRNMIRRPLPAGEERAIVCSRIAIGGNQASSKRLRRRAPADSCRYKDQSLSLSGVHAGRSPGYCATIAYAFDLKELLPRVPYRSREKGRCRRSRLSEGGGAAPAGFSVVQTGPPPAEMGMSGGPASPGKGAPDPGVRSAPPLRRRPHLTAHRRGSPVSNSSRRNR